MADSAFHWYAHGPVTDRRKSLATSKRLFVDGVRSPLWELTPTMECVVADEHPARTWLKRPAAVGADEPET
ncbi:MAG: hypothetical protein KDA38_05145, partial [Planctomycetales bacterium]|nr:hypothetical protein [Planctomycetales bacterium]